jgi:uncharacterized protein YjbI with pentapeptide repeats
MKHGKGGKRADFQGRDLHGANLSQWVLKGAKFQGANLRDANLTYCNFRGADFTRADLSGADLRKAIITRIYPIEAANFEYARLVGTKNLTFGWEATPMHGAVVDQTTLRLMR